MIYHVIFYHRINECFASFHRSDDEDSPPRGKVQKLVAMSLHDAEFCKEEQASFTPDMLDVAAECARYLWEEIDPRLRKVSWPVQYDCRSLHFLGFSGPEFVAVHGYAKNTLIFCRESNGIATTSWIHWPGASHAIMRLSSCMRNMAEWLRCQKTTECSTHLVHTCSRL